MAIKNSIKKNPAATTTGGLGVVVAAILSYFHIRLNVQETSALIVVVAAVPTFINWLKNQWAWLQGIVAEGTAGD